MITTAYWRVGIAIALALLGLIACHGGDGGNTRVASSGNSTSFVGTVSGFGSLYVNGVELKTEGASYRVDDEDRFDQAALAVGMKVRVKGTINDDGISGTASSIFYDDDVEGPIDAGSLTVVDASTKTFTIFGLAISVDAAGTVFDDGAGFDSLAEGQKLEVSGFFDGTQIVATRIEKQDDLDDEFELKGSVSSYDGASITLTLQNGVGAGPFELSPAAVLDIPADPAGLFVEVALMAQGANLVVIRIEAEAEEKLAEGQEVSVRGILSAAGGGLLINGLPFAVDENTEYQPASLEGTLAAGMELKIEGRLRDGVLIAKEIEAGDGAIELTARLITVAPTGAKNGAVTLDLGAGQTLTVQTTNSTQFVDHSTADLDGDHSFSLGELAAGIDFLVIKAYQNDSAQLVAAKVRREDAGQDTRLRAPLENSVGNASVTLLGITYTVDGGTGYEVNDADTDAAGFFGALSTGDGVKVTDAEPDGAAEKLVRYGASVGPPPVPPADLAVIDVSFKLDPRLTQSVYMGDRWVSPPTYSRVQEPGKALVVDARAHGLDAGGRQVDISPEWMPEDPEMVTVAPTQGRQVQITMLRIGQSLLRVVAGGISRDLTIKASAHLAGTLLVEISK